MNFLSISTTQTKASLSYFREDEDIINFSISRHLPPSRWIIQAISFIEKNFSDFFKSLNYIAVDIGPGSFTGIKVSLSFAQSIAISKDIFIVPISSCEGLAYFGIDGFKVATITNAHRNLFYYALYEKEKNDMREITRVSALTLDNINSELKKYDKRKLCIVIEKGMEDIFIHKGIVIINSMHNLSFAIGELSKKYRENFKSIPPESINPLFVRQPDVKLKDR